MAKLRVALALIAMLGFANADLYGAHSVNTILSFTGPNGARPYYGVLARGEGGVLYGATSSGGSANAGTVFSLTPPASPGGSWSEAVLYSFLGGSDGEDPLTMPTLYKGVLYGTTTDGGFTGASCPSGCGTVYRLLPPAGAGGSWTKETLYSFAASSSAEDGSNPESPLVIGASGEVYGTTYGGGLSGCGGNCGIVFELSPPSTEGEPWQAKTLYRFSGLDDGGVPVGGVIVSASGILYGTTSDGGTGNYGTVFELAPPVPPATTWTETVLYSFRVFQDANTPVSPLTFGPAGVLYGTTAFGGVLNQGGTVFQLTPPTIQGGTWTEKLLYSFPGKNGDGDQPIAPVTIGDGGVLYGTNTEGGDIGLCDHHGCGTVFQLVPPSAPGGAWTETVLTQFLDTSESGSYPYSGITLAPDGALYGATSGNSLLGTIFEIVHQ